MYSSRRYYYLAIVEELNITSAAKMLHVSQPSLTQYLNHLEESLSIKLIDRSYTPLRLTEAGRIYYEYLKECYRTEQVMLEKLRVIRGGVTLPLRLGMPMQLDNELTRTLLPEFIKTHQDVNLSIFEGTTLTCEEMLSQGKVDICFGHLIPQQDTGARFVLPYDNFIVKKLVCEKLVIVCNKENPIAAGRSSSLDNSLQIDPALLNTQTLFQMNPDYVICQASESQLKHYGVNPERRIVMSSVNSILRAIAENPESGFSYVLSYMLEYSPVDVDMEKFAVLRISDSDVTTEFSMMRRSDQKLSYDGRQLWKAIAENWH